MSGPVGDNVYRASGVIAAAASGGGITWSTTVQTTGFTAVASNAYFCNTTSGAFTVTLPASPAAGDQVAIKDYAGTFDTAPLTIGRNSEPINGAASDAVLTTQGESVTLLYIDGTRGWEDIYDATQDTTGGYLVQHTVVGGGGGGGTQTGSGGGAGGYRAIASDLYAVKWGTGVEITIGAGGAGSPYPTGTGFVGNTTSFGSVTSGGGARGHVPGSPNPGVPGEDGASGSGAVGGGGAVGAGNVPPVSPPQGNPGGLGATNPEAGQGGAGGSGGSGAAGQASTFSTMGGSGGVGTSFADLGPLAPSYGTTGPAPGRYFSGGGGSNCDSPPSQPGGAPGPTVGGPGPGGSGGGGAGGTPGGGGVGTAGTANTGGGGGGSGGSSGIGGNGGSGIVILRYVTASASPAVAGGDANATDASDTVRVFTSSGTFTP